MSQLAWFNSSSGLPSTAPRSQVTEQRKHFDSVTDAVDRMLDLAIVRGVASSLMASVSYASAPRIRSSIFQHFYEHPKALNGCGMLHVSVKGSGSEGDVIGQLYSDLTGRRPTGLAPPSLMRLLLSELRRRRVAFIVIEDFEDAFLTRGAMARRDLFSRLANLTNGFGPMHGPNVGIALALTGGPALTRHLPVEAEILPRLKIFPAGYDAATRCHQSTRRLDQESRSCTGRAPVQAVTDVGGRIPSHLE